MGTYLVISRWVFGSEKPWFAHVKSLGWVQAKIFNIFWFDICYNPIFLLSKIGSYFTHISLLLIS